MDDLTVTLKNGTEHRIHDCWCLPELIPNYRGSGPHYRHTSDRDEDLYLPVLTPAA